MEKKALIDRLGRHLRDLAAEYPKVWQNMEMFYNAQGEPDVPRWPGWVFVPCSASYTIACKGAPYPKKPLDIARIHHLAAWRVSQGIYTFDEGIFKAIAETGSGSDPLPADVLLRLPEWCVYLDFGSHFPGYVGCYVALEWDISKYKKNPKNPHLRELRLLFDQEDGELAPVILILTQGGSITDALVAVAKSGENVRYQVWQSDPEQAQVVHRRSRL